MHKRRAKWWKILKIVYFFINFQVFICVLAVVSCASYANAGDLGAIAALSSGGGGGGGYGGGHGGYGGGGDEGYSYEGTNRSMKCFALVFLLLFGNASACAMCVQSCDGQKIS